jgi:hypothetical protein
MHRSVLQTGASDGQAELKVGDAIETISRAHAPPDHGTRSSRPSDEIKADALKIPGR